ncbi:spore germination protein PE [Paenibacillaceae bacterium GAS479]|nr:spore germination protein PE [Paenibacillaceae bacterium GAS479]
MIDSDNSIRTSYIGSVEMITVGLSSVIHFGDTGTINAKSTGIAVQRQLDHRVGGEVDFSGYSLFNAPLNPLPEESLDEADVRTIRSNPVPAIQLGSLYVITYSSSSILLGGSAVEVNLESRLKHFRQYAYSLESTPTPNTEASEIIQNADTSGSKLTADND